MGSCPMPGWGWPSLMCSKQRGTPALSLASNTLAGSKTTHMFSFSKENFCKKPDTRDEGSGERGVCCISLFSPMRLGNCCFAFFSLKNISPLPRCTSRKGAEAAASQVISARQTARYGKPNLSEGRPLAYIIEIYNAQTLGHPGLS